jgi:HD-GYP domain-containing protein (c-di-GMP phosphodiesterase class II)
MTDQIPAQTRVPLGEAMDLIEIGTALPLQVLDSLGRLLLNEGQRLLSQSQLQLLLERGAWVEFDAVQRARQVRGAAAVGVTVSASASAPVPLAAPTPSLFDRWEQKVWVLDALLRRVGRDPALASELERFGVELMHLLERDVDVALFMAIRQDDRRFARYALTHGLHTAMLSALSARQLGWSEAQVLCIVRAALTMNVSMLELQAVLAEQAAPPTRRQMELIRSHPERSVQMLRDSGVADGDWLAAVHDHHEQGGGGGYPRGLADVSEMARVLRAADVFMAKVTPRAARAPLTPQQAARDLFQQEAGGHVASALIKSVGVHPPGELVQLRNGEVAIVTRRAAKGPAPMAAAISDSRGQPMVATVLRDTAQAAFAITGPCADRARFVRVPPERVYGLIAG